MSIYSISNEGNDLKICHVGHFSETEVQVPSMQKFAPVELNPVERYLAFFKSKKLSNDGKLPWIISKSIKMRVMT